MVVASEFQAKKKSHWDDFDYEFWLDWSSRHTSKGRDYLDGKGAFSQGLTLESGDFGFELNRSGAMDDGTKEWDFELSYFRSLESFSYYAAYQYSDWSSQDFQFGGSNLEFGVSYFDLPAGFWIDGDVEYSIDRGGIFSEITIGAELELSPRFTLTPSLGIGHNAGFFDEGHDGWNHAVATLSADFSLTDELYLNISAAYNRAINRKMDFTKYPDDALLDDFFWTGLTFSVGGDRKRSKVRQTPELEAWEVTLGTSIWASAMSGSITIGDDFLGKVQPANNSYDQLHTGVSIEFNRKSWSLLLGGSHVSYGAEIPPPLPIFEASPTEMRATGLQLAAGYRILESRLARVDLLAGLRYNFFESESELDEAGGRNMEWIDPALGVRLRMNLIEDWDLAARAEYGGFGLGSDQFWQVDLGLEYQFSDHLSAELRYQHLDVDYAKGSNAAEFAFKGLKAGVRYRF